ncbi:hypothetical protein RHGRI_001955 [Rhododendron griersonianum]|uniref:NADH dehydrogenase subunit 6 n=1 Tax=Rhododendron griersonianum TaxID=479676 RepID=A0AAV6LNB7_9ERIC|nr:hypothetical protein RHGRI_001955 [Rhododendron griersonianum]
MASPTRSSMLPQQWFLMAAATLLCALLGYIVYGAVMSTAAELLQRLLMVSPLLLVIAVHWLSSSHGLDLRVPGTEPGAIHRAGGSPWGIAFVLLLLLFLISFQPSQRLHASVFF